MARTCPGWRSSAGRQMRKVLVAGLLTCGALAVAGDAAGAGACDTTCSHGGGVGSRGGGTAQSDGPICGPPLPDIVCTLGDGGGASRP